MKNGELEDGWAPMMLTPPQVAARLGLTRGTLAKWRLRGEGPPFVKLGSAVRYPVDEFERYVQSLPLMGKKHEER